MVSGFEHKTYPQLKRIYTGALEKCRTGAAGGLFAFTTSEGGKGTGTPSIITLCDRLLAVESNGAYEKKSTEKTSIWPKIEDIYTKYEEWRLSDMDNLANKLNVTILHEMTHTNLALVEWPDDALKTGDRDWRTIPRSVRETQEDYSHQLGFRGWDTIDSSFQNMLKEKDIWNASSLAMFGLLMWTYEKVGKSFRWDRFGDILPREV